MTQTKPTIWYRLTAFVLIVLFCYDLAAAQILDLTSGREISVEVLAERLRSADVVLLGELHDNPHHHQARAAFYSRDCVYSLR